MIRISFRRLFAFIFTLILCLLVGPALILAGTIDVQTRFSDNTKQISKSLQKSTTYTGAGLDLRAISVTATESSNDISSAIGDAGVAYILNSGSGTVHAGDSSADYFTELRAGQFAIIPLTTNTSTLFFKSNADETNTVEYLVTER